jgi:integrase
VEKLTTADIDDFYGYLMRSTAEGPFACTWNLYSSPRRAASRPVAGGPVGVDVDESRLDASSPRPKPADIRSPSPADVMTLLDWANEHNPPLFCFPRLAASAGARRSQLLALRWGDVDWEACRDRRRSTNC